MCNNRGSIILPIIIATILILCAGCTVTLNIKETFNYNTSDSVYLGVAYPFSDPSTQTFVKGVDLAVYEINNGGGILNRKLETVKCDDNGSVTTGSEVAQGFVDDKRISAVIGHWNSRVSMAAAGIYNGAGLPMISPTSTAPGLTMKGYTGVFRALPNDIRYGEKVARYAIKKGYSKTVIYYADDEYGKGLADAYEDEGRLSGLEVVDRITGTYATGLKEVIYRWKAFDYDSILVADVMPQAGEFIKMVREAGITVPILGASGTDDAGFINLVGKAAEGVVMPTIFNPNSSEPKVYDFVEKYKKAYGELPDAWSSQGYKIVMLIKDAIQATGSPVPTEIAAELKKKSNMEGEIASDRLIMKVVKEGKYEYLPDEGE